MATNCAVCDRDARDAEEAMSIALDLADIAHPEDAFDIDLIWHRRERHREKILGKIKTWAALSQGECS
ncbi:MAG TPA: hypothetical protein VJX23_05245 [Candidatus Binataceae bacterium]|nr:hypothetical protein [Candidatus Binataceae bacterium]